MKKVLFISTRPPFPLYNGSAIRTFQAIKFFYESSYIVDILYLTTQNDNAITNQGLKQYCRNIYTFKISTFKSYLKVIWGFLSNRKPLQVNYYYFKSIEKIFLQNVSDYDIIFYNNIRTAEYLKHIGSYKIMDFVDAISMNYEKAISRKGGLWHYIYRIDHQRCLKYEREILACFDKCMIISEIDRSYILYNKCPYEISVIENYVRLHEDTINHKDKNYNIVFVGTMNYEPNISAVNYFVDKIYPSLLERYPQLKFYIVGNRPSKEVLKLASKNILVTGFVDDVWEYLKKSAVVVIPMISGAGIQNKILEAMSIGGCVVTTPIGFEGLKHDEGAPLVVHSEEDMIVKISSLLDSVELRTIMGNKAKQYIAENYSENIIFSKFKDFINIHNS